MLHTVGFLWHLTFRALKACQVFERQERPLRYRWAAESYT